MRTELNQKADSTGNPKKGVSNGRFYEIQKLDERTGMPQYYITDNVIMAATISTNRVINSLGLDGMGINISMWDEGAVLQTHRELINHTLIGLFNLIYNLFRYEQVVRLNILNVSNR